MSGRAAAAPVVLDVHAALFPSGGIGRSVRDLAAALATRPDAPPARFAYPARLPGAASPPWPAHTLSPLPGSDRRRRWTYLASTLAPALADRYYGSPALVHSPAGYGPVFARAKHLVTIHDLTAITHPEWHAPRTQGFFHRMIPASILNADRIVCDSDWTRAQLLERYAVEPSRAETVHLSVSPHFGPVPRERALGHLARRFSLEPPFVLHVGTLEPRKNHVTLVAAFERLRRAGFPGTLVLVGPDGWRFEPILARIESSPERAAIRRLAEAGDEDLLALYSACAVFAFPSLDEGFGLPPLEAMACGAACVTSAGNSLGEVTADGAEHVPAEDAEALSGALVTLWRDEGRRASLAARGRARAAHFTPERWIARMFAIYSELAAGAR